MNAPVRRSLLAAVAAVGVAILAFTVTPASADTTGLPNSMAAAGDSMTQAYNVDWPYAGHDNPQFSWSTGTDPAVKSQYQRIVAANPTINGNAYNDAVTGSKMVSLDAQLQSAASQHAGYVTVLMGANDVCTPTIADMTPVSTFQAQFQQALSNFVGANPRARVFVSSIPNIYQMWQTLHGDPNAAGVWAQYGICQSMLSAANTETDRQRVLAQEKAFNKVLALVCGKYRQCRFDGNAAFNTALTAADISQVDYFHPSISGQNKLASVSWSAGYWPGV